MKYILIIILSFSFLYTGAQPVDSCKIYRLQRDTFMHMWSTDQKQLEKIKFYLSICDKNKKNDKFLKGWIKRTVNK